MATTINGQLRLAMNRTAAPSRLAMSSPTQMVCWAKAVLRAVRQGWMTDRGVQHIAALAALSREMRRRRKRVESRVVPALPIAVASDYDPSGRQVVDPATGNPPHGEPESQVREQPRGPQAGVIPADAEEDVPQAEEDVERWDGLG